MSFPLERPVYVVEGEIVISQFIASGIDIELFDQLIALQSNLSDGMTPQELYGFLAACNLVMGEGKSRDAYQREGVESPTEVKRVDQLILDEGFSHHGIIEREGVVMASIVLHKKVLRE